MGGFYDFRKPKVNHIYMIKFKLSRCKDGARIRDWRGGAGISSLINIAQKKMKQIKKDKIFKKREKRKRFYRHLERKREGKKIEEKIFKLV